jgi:hypothetical protein
MADSVSQNNIPIFKGDTIGIIGQSGYTSSVHLHISTQAVHPEYGSTFVNPARLFNPLLYQNVLAPLTKAKIELLHHWSDSALFRITWPYNQTINRFLFINESFNVAFNKEHAYSTGSSLRDNMDCIPGIKIFAYQFNGKRTAKYRYELEKENMPAIYPASPQRDTNIAMYNYSHIPITHDSVAFVYDFIVEDLPTGYDKNKFVVQLSDVWGYTVEGSIDAAFIKRNQHKPQTAIFPNPATDEINLSFDSKWDSRKIELLNSYGETFYSLITEKSEENLNIRHLPAGIYFVSIKSESRSEIVKIIVTNQ